MAQIRYLEKFYSSEDLGDYYTCISGKLWECVDIVKEEETGSVYYTYLYRGDSEEYDREEEGPKESA